MKKVLALLSTSNQLYYCSSYLIRHEIIKAARKSFLAAQIDEVSKAIHTLPIELTE